MSRAAPWVGTLLIIVTCCLAPLRPAAAQEVVGVDLAPLIEEAAKHRNRFAVNVPHRVSIATHGEWTTRGSTRYWTYSVRIPTAVSMSFYAVPVRLPESAQVTVSGIAASATYRASDIARGSLWGSPLLGDTLTFSLSVSAADASKVQFEVASLQAGYRGLAPGVADHPHYQRLQSSKAAATCIQNYSCNATDANRGPAKATVAILIGNIGQCTGTLINNTRQDGRPYILTARHCENGELGGGAPGAAAQITIYWDAVSACGELLGSLYTGLLTTQSGARTVVEQQDAWLIELDRAPTVVDPYYAGWDATGGVFVGGYSVHHAMGRDQQFTTWHGQAILQHILGRVLDAPYDSDFWGLVNSFGNVGPGASGGALFDPDNRVVGSASLAYLTGPQSDGVCPSATPPAPSPATITAQYTALSAVWGSAADASSTTGGTTLRSVLDPDATGALTLDGIGYMPLFLNANTGNQRTDQSVTFSWTAPWAQSCTATGGSSGDGWAGSKPTSGSAQVTSIAGGLVTYGLTCTAGDRSGKASASVNWLFIPPLISLRGPTQPVMIGTPYDLEWDSNTQPCTASGGLAGDGWAGAKSLLGKQTFQATQLGSVTYSYSCGTGVRSGTRQVTVDVVPPSITLSADATRLRTGSSFNIRWHSDAIGVCSGSGGVPSWAANTQDVQSSGSTLSLSNVPGTFTYTMTCSGGGLSASSSFTIEFVDEPAASTLTALVATQEIFVQGQVPPNLPANLQWTSNTSGCGIASIGPVGNRSVDLQGQYPAGTAAAFEFIAGHYEYELNCPGAPLQRVSIEWVAAHPQVTLVGPDVKFWLPGKEYGLFWTSNTVPCTASGGVPGDGWAGFKGNSVHNSQDVRAATVPGTYTYSLTCGTGSSVGTADLVVTIPPPAVTLTATPTTQFIQRAVNLQWDATVYPCTPNADGAGVDWGPVMGASGQWPNAQSSPGTYTYTITCGTGADAVTASTQVTFRTGRPTELTASATNVPVNTSVTLTWQSVSGACNATGGVDGDGWFGPKPSSGSTIVTSPIAALVGYALDCNGDMDNVAITYTGDVSSESSSAPRPSATLTSDRSSQVAGQVITLTWNSRNADACFATGGSGGDGWAGSVSLSGSMSITRPSAGSATYGITCTGAVPASTAQTTVAFSAAPGTGGGDSSGGGGGGGGGALDRYTLLLLLLLLLGLLAQIRLSARARRAAGPAPPSACTPDSTYRCSAHK